MIDDTLRRLKQLPEGLNIEYLKVIAISLKTNMKANYCHLNRDT